RAGPLAAMLDTSSAQILELLDELTRRLLLRPAAAGPGLFRFDHDLVRRAVYEGIAPARRRLLHERAARGEGDPASLGRHSWLAGHPERAVDLLRSAGEEALARFATSEAEDLFQSALAAAGEAGRAAPERSDLLDRIGRARSARG